MPRGRDEGHSGRGRRRAGGEDRSGASGRGSRGRRGVGGRTPAGIDRARTREGAPPRPGGKPQAGPPRPDLPQDAQADLPPGVRREIERSVRGPVAREVVLALSLGSDALDAEDGARALPYLEWAKHTAPRVAAIREALGIARYLSGDFAGALTELQAYRRISGRADQNHVIADCLRAVGRTPERIPELVEEMGADVDAERRTEGLIVWAGWLADSGDVPAARAVLRRGLGDEVASPEEHDLRLWYVAADLAERDGDREAAATYFGRIAAAVEGFFDTEERLRRLS